MEQTVRYKQFDLIVTVKLDNSSVNLYEIVVIARHIDHAQRDCTKFGNEEQAYEFGLQEAQKWLDGQDIQLWPRLISTVTFLTFQNAIGLGVEFIDQIEKAQD